MSFPLLLDGQRHDIEIIRRRPHLVLRVDGRDHIVQALGNSGDGALRLTIDGREVSAMRASDGDCQVVRIAGRTFTVTQADDGSGSGTGENLSDLRAPMPGAVIQIHAAPGDSVSEGSPLITIESMKLQTVLGSPRAGIVAEIPVTLDELFGKDHVLVRLEAEDMTDA